VGRYSAENSKVFSRFTSWVNPQTGVDVKPIQVKEDKMTTRYMEFFIDDHKIAVWFVSEYEFIWEVE